IRRRPDAVTIMIGGRNLNADAPPATVRVSIDGRAAGVLSASPGFFLRFLDLPAGALAGEGPYAHLTVAADRPRLAVEQFDAQTPSGVVFGFGDGWHEMEYNPAIGRVWRWISERGEIRLHGGSGGRPLRMRLTGETENVPGATRVSIRIGDRLISQPAVER